MPSFQTTPGVYLENLAELNRSLKLLGPKVQAAAKAGMLEGAEPIRRNAEDLARDEISGMQRSKRKPPPWSIQRSGQTVHEVYIAPRERGVKSKTDPSRRRLNFVGVMFGKSYNPAFERGRPLLVQTVDNWLGKVVDGF